MKCRCNSKMVKVNFYVWRCLSCSFRTTTNTSERIRTMVENGLWNGESSLRLAYPGGPWISSPTPCPYASPEDFGL